MLKLNTKLSLLSLKGEKLKEEKGEELITVGMVLANVLSGHVEKPHKGYVLAKKFATEPSVDLLAEDVVYIKKEIEKATYLSALVAGQLIEILDGDEKDTNSRSNKKS